MPPVNNPKRSPSRSRISGTDSVRVHSAANSIASGSPSNSWHNRATAPSFDSSSAKPGSTAAARSANSSSASRLSRPDHSRATRIGGTGHTCSPAIPNGR
ncbi:hypothetical protein [Saccharopolyspora rectivirgula]|uniref:hypothetical protein n=1 Tax=Saccharopolyspora rectivirgula TaxID=28042 RepID=UPI0024090C4E|nr:hypothetical protein [Saccharopolyspora rectivirgula]